LLAVDVGRRDVGFLAFAVSEDSGLGSMPLAFMYAVGSVTGSSFVICRATRSAVCSCSRSCSALRACSFSAASASILAFCSGSKA
jgi:hypothetical protein